MGLQCDQQIRIPGTAPAAFRACKHSAAEGETKCARHGGRPMRPRRPAATLETVAASVLRPGGPVRVYIAGPYTKGDVAVNVRNAIVAGQEVLEAGHVPFIPHLNHFWHLLLPQEYAVWIRLDLEWLHQCEALIRLPGDSAGADAEYVEACRVGIPVFRSVEAFLSAKWQVG